MSGETTITVRLAQRHDYRFDNDFGAGVPPLATDEPPPLGGGAGPSPVQLLAASVGNCLAASLLFALRKFRQDPGSIGCTVTASIGRNADKRLRIVAMRAQLRLGVGAAGLAHLDRVLSTFEDFCTVTASLRAAFPVSVEVEDALGAKLSAASPARPARPARVPGDAVTP